jgi:hypothetical protein
MCEVPHCWIGIKEGKMKVMVIEILKHVKVEYHTTKITIPK